MNVTPIFSKDTITVSTNANGNAWVQNTARILLAGYINGYIAVPFKADAAWFLAVYEWDGTKYNPKKNTNNLSATVIWAY